MQYPNTYQQAYRSISPVVGLKGRPVSSLEEARVAQVDFDGSISFFPDLANGKIYTKQINMDGTVTMNCYSYTEIPAPKTEQDLFVTKEEFQKQIDNFNNIIAQLKTPATVVPQTPTSKPAPNINF